MTDFHPFQRRTASNDEDLFRRHATARDRDALVRLVGGERDLGGPEGQLLEQQHQLPEQAAPAELGFVQLRIGVVVIEQEFLAEQLPEAADQEEQVGRIAGMDDVEALPEEYSPAQGEREGERGGIFEQVSRCALCFREVITQDLDPIEIEPAARTGRRRRSPH